VPSAEQWADSKLLGTFTIVWQVTPVPGKAGSTAEIYITQGAGARPPKFGDVIAFPTFHVGVYLGRGLYISATTQNPYRGIQQDDVVIHFVNMNYEQLYRSPEKQ